jgi:glycosyltransferase involved in cell wall biosynthesis
MKVLFQNRRKDAWLGGDWVQLENTANALRKLGIEVDINEEPFISPPEKILDYDIVHLFNFSMQWTKYQLWVARKWKKPVVCSMIYHENDSFVPYDLQQIMMNELSYAIFQTKGEAERAKRHLSVPEEKIKYVGNGIDSWWLEKSDKVVPYDPFVLTVGRIEPSKGMLACAKACKELKLPYICIGEGKEEEYIEELRAEGAIVLGKMTKEELKPYYFSAKVYCQPSSAETWGLAIDEASSQGTPCVLTSMCERDDYPFIRCEFDNVESIKSAIHEAWKLPKSYTHAKQLKTWDDIGREILDIYKTI